MNYLCSTAKSALRSVCVSEELKQIRKGHVISKLLEGKLLGYVCQHMSQARIWRENQNRFKLGFRCSMSLVPRRISLDHQILRLEDDIFYDMGSHRQNKKRIPFASAIFLLAASALCFPCVLSGVRSGWLSDCHIVRVSHSADTSKY